MIATSLAALLAAAFVLPALLKWRRADEFAASLQWLAGVRAHAAAAAVCIGECIIAALVVLAPQVGAAAAAAWVACATLYLGALLARTRSAECNCWGSVRRHEGVRRGLLPAWYALRNTAYLGVAIAVAATNGGGSASAALVTVALALPYVVVCAGLLAGIAALRRTLARGGDIALERELRPRFRRPGLVQAFRATPSSG
jgi:hypothetical protein